MPWPLLARDSGRLSQVHLSAAAEQAWPPFVLVSGLLLIGLVANCDGLFEQTGRFLQGLAGPPVALLAAHACCSSRWSALSSTSTQLWCS
ncbi:MAG: hypothetical protein ACLQMH_11850 [Solirubrobacteraceae bacterium]